MNSMLPTRVSALLIVIALMAALLAGCGKKGPLYLPDGSRPAQSLAPAP
jgi:predicted small lipoprotein YifL